jgi:uncharacterized membrane protein YqjE
VIVNDSRVNELKGDSIPELLRRLSGETTTLVRQEIALATVELGEKAKAAGAGAALLGVAAVFGVGAFGAITACLIAALALALPTWAAALIVAAVYAIAGAIIAQSGRSRLAHATPVMPQQTTQTVKEDVEWVKTRAQSGRK